MIRIFIAWLLFLLGAPIAAQAAEGRDMGFEAAKALYAERAVVEKHVAAVSAFAKLGDAYPNDREIQIWCARTASYAAHRIFDSQVKQMVAKRGVTCAERLLKKDKGDYEGRMWWLMSRLRYEAARGVIDALKAAPRFKGFIAKMIKDNPKHPAGYMMLGTLMRELPGPPVSFGDPQKALKLLLKAEQLAPNHPEILLELAQAYAKVGEVELARQTYIRCVDKGTTRVDLEWESQDARNYAQKMLEEMRP